MPKAALNEGLIQPNTKIWIWLLNAYYEFNILIFVHIITKPGGCFNIKQAELLNQLTLCLLRNFTDIDPYLYTPSSDLNSVIPLRARFMGPTWGPLGANRTQVGPMRATWTLFFGTLFHKEIFCTRNKEVGRLELAFNSECSLGSFNKL